MVVGDAGTEEKLAFPELLEAEVANVRSLQTVQAMSSAENECCQATNNVHTQTDNDSNSGNAEGHSQERLGDVSESTQKSEPSRHCTSVCGKILRLMGDEQTSRTYGRHLRNMGDEIFCRYAIRRSLEHLVQAVANERDNERNSLRQRHRRPSSS